jgi:DNA-binding CsgD family transcriptional regulator
MEKALGLFNRVCQSNFYMVDYHAQTLIVGKTMPSLTHSGYSREMIEIEGLDFYTRLLLDEEKKWLAEMNKEAFEIFHSYPESERFNLEFYYDLIAQTSNLQKIVLHHKLVPFKLDKNGNMWLGLVHVTISSFTSTFSKARIVNIQTGEQFDYIDGKFIQSTITALDRDELAILAHTAKDIPNKQIADLLKISESNLKRKRLSLFDKLGVKTPAAAVYKATMLKII